MLSLLALLACSEPPPPTSTRTGTTAAPEGPGTTDSTDDSSTSSGEDSPTDSPPTIGDTDSDADSATTLPPGELLIEQIKTDGSEIGEAALVVGPDGTVVLIDVGDAIDAPLILEAIDHHLPERRVDWVILTHYHSDHIGGFASLFEPSEANGGQPVVVSGAVIHRGPYDLDRRALHEEAFEPTCTLLVSEAWAPARLELCDGAERGPCDLMGTGGPWPVSSCEGLFLGDLSDPSDDGEGQLTTLPLGGGATLTLFLVNGVLGAGGEAITSAQDGAPIDYTGIGHENARSIAGFIRYGAFDYVFGGDLSGQNPNLEGFVAGRGAALVEDGAIDVIHANHHGFQQATNQEWLDWLAPPDGQTRNMIFGTSYEHDGAPAQAVLDRAAESMGGGYLWVTEFGRLSGSHKQVRCRDRSVLLRTEEAGASYQITDRLGGELGGGITFDSVQPRSVSGKSR